MQSTTFTCALLLLVAHILLIDASAKYKDCEYSELTNCNKVFMYDFTNAVPVVQSLSSVYCRGFQLYANCLSSSTCVGKFVDLNRFMILQHMIMDKTLQVCPHHNVDPLKKLVQVNKKYRKKIEDVTNLGDADQFEECAAKIHRKCTSQMADDLSRDNRMCFGVENFLQCYENPGISCEARIYIDFVKITKKVAKTLVKMFKDRKGLMPNC